MSARQAIWDYLVISEDERDRLPALGREGWELVGVGGCPDERLLYLKREGPDLRERVTLDQRKHYFKSLGLDPDPQTERTTE
ncbi:MAG: hypothetical protein ACRDJC_00445 [Thermomicrobiales bacterium]